MVVCKDDTTQAVHPWCILANTREALLWSIFVLHTTTTVLTVISILYLCFLNKSSQLEVVQVFTFSYQQVYLVDIIGIQLIAAFLLWLWVTGLQWLKNLISCSNKKKCDNWCDARKEFINQLLFKLNARQSAQMNQSCNLKQEYFVTSQQYYCTEKC